MVCLVLGNPKVPWEPWAAQDSSGAAECQCQAEGLPFWVLGYLLKSIWGTCWDTWRCIPTRRDRWGFIYIYIYI